MGHSLMTGDGVASSLTHIATTATISIDAAITIRGAPTIVSITIMAIVVSTLTSIPPISSMVLDSTDGPTIRGEYLLPMPGVSALRRGSVITAGISRPIPPTQHHRFGSQTM